MSMPKKKPAAKPAKKGARKKWRKPVLKKHGVLSIVEGD